MAFIAWYQGVFGLMLAGIVLYLLALPPVELWWLGWLVAACWTPVLRRKTLSHAQIATVSPNQNDQKSKKRHRRLLRGHPYRQIWLVGVIFWAVAVHWVCYAHWATCFGWVAMSCYLGIYFPLFVFFARTVHHIPVFGKFRFPVWFAAPVAWLAVMYLQKTLMGGFGFALLEHTQMRQTALIQLADVGGESLVGAVMIFVGVLIGYCLPVDLQPSPTRNLSPRRIAACSLAVALTFLFLIDYAKFRESQLLPSAKPPISVALLQGNYKASLSAPPKWYEEIFDNYTKLAIDTARNQQHNVDLIIWPESTCILPWVDVDRSELSQDTLKRLTEDGIKKLLSEENKKIFELSQQIGKPCIYGAASCVYSEKKDRYFQYNSALLIENANTIDYDSSRRGETAPKYFRYDKMLLVMFGEYVPLAEYLPESFFLKTLCQRADFGKTPVCIFLHKIIDNKFDHNNRDNKEFESYRASANICFESSSSSLIRQQILTLSERGEEPDFLINISNDGWFRHSSQIDMHLATHIFRAVENRKPCMAATNGGFSVGIDGSGNILAIGERAKNQAVYVDLSTDNRFAYYHCLGSIFHIVSLGTVIVLITFAFFIKRQAC